MTKPWFASGRWRIVWVVSALFAPAVFAAEAEPKSAPLRFEVRFQVWLTNTSESGRLFIVLSSPSPDSPEPRLGLGHTGPDAPQAFARDVHSPSLGTLVSIDQSDFGFPSRNLTALPPGEYVVQALFEANPDIRLPNAPGNLYSKPQKMRLDPALSGTIRLELTQQIPPEVLPPDTDQVKFIKFQSRLLSEFYHRPIFLRAAVVLPRDYAQQTSLRYPLWVRIGGFGSRYSVVNSGRPFRSIWLADGTPRVLLLQLDGAGPLGDPYYVNSANHGPYGDALVKELIPYVEKNFRAVAEPRARFLSGTSTGGWVSLALQVFYADYFNGTWSSCPDPVDFRAYELVNIYEDADAYTDAAGTERASERDLKGAVVLTMRREVGAENLLGTGNSYTMSGQQWGAWNAAYSPRGADGLPVPLWDPQTGKIDHSVAEQWKKYDLRLVLAKDWKQLAPRLRGKIHISSGEADQYFLNNAVHLLDEFLSKADPPFEGSIDYGPGKGHGWSKVTLKGMLEEMQARATAK
jgi:hypothetical protein